MAFIPVPNVAEVELIFLWLGQRVENTLYFKLPSAPTPIDLGNLATAVGGWYDEAILPSQGEGLLHLLTIATDLTTETSPSIAVPAPSGTTGVDATNPLPGNATWTISFHTAERGRSARGRNYLVGLCEDMISGNQMLVPFADNVREAYATLPTAAGLGDWQHVVVSRFHDNAPRTEGIAIPVTAYVITDYNLDSQRRRLTGRGT